MLKIKINKKLSESDEQDIHYSYKKIKEMSSMAGGSVAGAAGSNGWSTKEEYNKKKKKALFEGGNVFKNDDLTAGTKKINREDVDGTLEWLEDIVGIPLVDNKLGTTGKKETSGDLDIAVDSSSVTKEEIVNKLLQWLLQNKPELELDKLPSAKGKAAKELKKRFRKWVAKTGSSVHFKTPILGDESNGFVQTDFMLGDMGFLKWSAQPELGDRYKGGHRQVLINAIAKTKGYAWSGFRGLKDRQTSEIIDDPDKIARILFNGKLNKDQMASIENIIEFINDKNNVSDEEYAIIHKMANDVFPLEHRKEAINEGSLPKGRIHHPEDLILWNGADGGTTALELISKALGKENFTSLKWDGSPAVVFGRDQTGDFIFADKNAFVVKSYDGKVKSPEHMKDVLINKRHLDKGKEPSESYLAFANNMINAFKKVEKVFPENFSGYYFGDLLYFNKPEQQNGKYVFQPNVVKYAVDANSELGADIAKSEIGIAVHGRINPDGTKEPLGDFKNTLMGDMLLLGPVMSETDIDFEQDKIESLKSEIKSAAPALSLVTSDEMRSKKLSDLPNILYKYINSQTGNNFENLSGNFPSWIEAEPKLSSAKKQALKEVLANNSSEFQVVFDVYKKIMDLKNEVIQKIDNENDGIQASIGDVNTGEGYVIYDPTQPIKLVDRSKFSLANRSIVREGMESGLQNLLFIPGGFKPPHKGHLELIKQAIAKAGPIDKAFVVSGADSRDNITAEKAKKVFEVLLQAEGLSDLVELVYFEAIPTDRTYKDTPANRKKGVVGEPVMTNSPMVKVGMLASEKANNGANVMVAASKADPQHNKALSRIINHIAGLSEKEFEVSTIAIDPVSVSPDKKVSATDMRDSINKKDFESFRTFLPDSIDEKTASELFNVLLGKETNYIMENKKLILQKYIKGKTIEETLIRKYIRGRIIESRLLTELSDNELTSSTGTNIAAKTLEKFIKGLPTQYKTLASSKEQRLSYAAHYIQALKNSMISVLAKKGLDLSTTDEPVGLAVGGAPSGEEFKVARASEEEPEELMQEQEEDDIDVDLDLDADMAGPDQPDEEIGEINPESEAIPVTPEEKAQLKKEKEAEASAKKVVDPDGEQPMPVISGLDDTGRELASDDVKVAIAAVRDGINMLTETKDVKDFISTLITQIKIRFNLAEREITGTDATKINSQEISSAEKFMNQLEESKNTSNIDKYLVESLRKMMRDNASRV